MTPMQIDHQTHKKPEGRFSGVMSEFAPRLYGYLIMRLGNKEDAQDLAQEAYLRLLRVDKNKIIEKPESYLFRIASNLANEFALQKKRTPPMLDFELLDMTNECDNGNAFELNLQHRDALRQLTLILEELPPHYRAILILKKRDGLSREEIAQELGLSVHTVKKYLARAAAHCRERWGE